MPKTRQRLAAQVAKATQHTASPRSNAVAVEAPPVRRHVRRRDDEILQMQRTIGNKATTQMIGNMVQRGGSSKENTGPASRPFTDFNAKQYRVSGREPNRKIEEVVRTVNDQGSVEYQAVGLVVGFEANRPLLEPYPEPVSLGDWYPQVTHVNGMNVRPESGIRDAVSLQESINQTLEGDDAALDQGAVDVLYTYSATLNFVPDVWDSLKGKLSISDDVTAVQRQIMLDAVHNQHRTTVSAHSRGTIKTDNAVREAHSTLTEEYLPHVWEEVKRVLKLNWFQRMLVNGTVREIAESRAAEMMNMYINLVYAGNAVEFPSSVLPIDFIVGSHDAISLLVGTYTEWGAKWNHSESTMTGVSGGGHGYRENYAAPAGRLIGQDITRHR